MMAAAARGGREAVEVDKFKTDLLFGNEDSLKIGFQFDYLISAKLSGFSPHSLIESLTIHGAVGCFGMITEKL